MQRPWPKADGVLDSKDFGALAGIPELVQYDCAIYRGQDGDIDYSQPVAYMNLDDTQISIENQDLPPNTIWHYVRCRLSQCGLRSEPSDPCIIMIDENGDMLGMTPNAPTDLTAELLIGGKVRLRWRYSHQQEEIAPTGFNIYINSGDGFDFASADDTIKYRFSSEFNWTSDILNHGQVYKFCIRSYRTGGGESQNTNFISAIPDDEGPQAITGLRISWIEI